MGKVAFLGLGVMGYPMAGHIKEKSAHEVFVFNRTHSKAEAWATEYGGQACASVADAVEDADFVFACLGGDDDVREMTTGENGAFQYMKPGSIFIDNTTASADLARALAAAAHERGFAFLDAPVSGGQAGAESGVLTVMVGGDEDVFARAEPVISCYARAVRLLGGAGAGQLTKMVNQICIAGLLQGLSEGIHFGKRAGLDIPAVVDVIAQGAAGSWQMQNRGETMAAGEFDFGFAVKWMRKDLGMCLNEAKRNGSHLPVTALVDQYYSAVEAMGGTRWDTSSLIALLDRD